MLIPCGCSLLNKKRLKAVKLSYMLLEKNQLGCKRKREPLIIKQKNVTEHTKGVGNLTCSFLVWRRTICFCSRIQPKVQCEIDVSSLHSKRGKLDRLRCWRRNLQIICTSVMTISLHARQSLSH